MRRYASARTASPREARRRVPPARTCRRRGPRSGRHRRRWRNARRPIARRRARPRRGDGRAIRLPGTPPGPRGSCTPEDIRPEVAEGGPEGGLPHGPVAPGPGRTALGPPEDVPGHDPDRPRIGLRAGGRPAPTEARPGDQAEPEGRDADEHAPRPGEDGVSPGGRGRAAAPPRSRSLAGDVQQEHRQDGRNRVADMVPPRPDGRRG